MSLFIGEKFKSLRRERKLTQDNLTSEVLSRPTLSKIETNKVLPSIEQLIYLSKKLEVSIGYFFNNELLSQFDNTSSSISTMYENKNYTEIINNYEMKKYSCSLIDLYYIGLSYFNLDLFYNSSKMLKKFVASYKNENYETKKAYAVEAATALNTLAKIVLRNKNYEKALKYLFAALNYVLSYNYSDKEIYFILNNNIGSIYCYLGNYTSAKYELENFLNKTSNFYYNKIVASIYLNLNIACFHLGDYEKSLDYIKKSIFLFNITKEVTYEAECYINYLNCLRHMNKFKEGILLADELINNENLPTNFEDTYKLQKLIINYNMENMDYIKNNYLDINTKYLNKKSLIDYYFICGFTEYNNDNYTRSHKYFLKCEKYLLKNNRYLDLGVMYKLFSYILESEEYMHKSNHYLSQYEISVPSLSVNLTLPSKIKTQNVL